MATLFCKWPPAEKSGADVYKAECDTQFAAITNEPGGVWALVREDKNGNWTVPLFGPPWPSAEDPVSEPPSCAALRADAVVVETPEWPEPEDA